MKVFRFAKSSYSASGPDCVEVARNVPGAVAVRDSKRAAGPVVTVSPGAWGAFAAYARGPEILKEL